MSQYKITNITNNLIISIAYDHILNTSLQIIKITSITCIIHYIQYNNIIN